MAEIDQNRPAPPDAPGGPGTENQQQKQEQERQEQEQRQQQAGEGFGGEIPSRMPGPVSSDIPEGRPVERKAPGRGGARGTAARRRPPQQVPPRHPPVCPWTAGGSTRIGGPLCAPCS